VSGTRGRIATIGVGTAALLGIAVPAFAHAQASLDNAHAGATNVTLRLNAEAESTTAGIKSLDVTLPSGIAPDQVSLASAPQGWTFTRTAQGFTVSGTALPTGTDATTSLRIAALPGAPTLLAFKTLVTYADGKVDRWIEAPSSAVPTPPNPAATVSLEPAVHATATSAPATNLVSPNAALRHNPSPAATAGTSKTQTALLWVIVGALLILLLVLGVVLWRRRTRLHTND
jgi:hypothetical protein